MTEIPASADAIPAQRDEDGGVELNETPCPGCGAVSFVDFARRDALAFCPNCDFPLFWARERVVTLGGGELTGDGLRRLPGTAGRAALASLLCPSCTEPNPPSNGFCVRCGADLHPAPVVAAAPPPPEPEPEPEPVVARRRWWLWAVATLALLALVLGLYFGLS